MYCKNCAKELQSNESFCSRCGAPAGAGNSFCPGCGRPVPPDARFCPGCGKSFAVGGGQAPGQEGHTDPNTGYSQGNTGYTDPNGGYTDPNAAPGGTAYGSPNPPYGASYQPPRPVSPPKSRLAAGLGIFLGFLGIHRFYLGYTGIALTQLLLSVLSCFVFAPAIAIWGLVEGILILCNNYITVDAHGQPLTD